jgi:hypothetical protein
MKLLAKMIGCLLILMPYLAGQEKDPNPAPPDVNFLISGVVVSAIRGEALARTRVIITPVGQRAQVQSTLTGDDGRFVFINVFPGKYSLVAERNGYSLQGFEQHDAYASAIAVGSGKKSTDLVFRLNPDAIISGRVTDEHEEAVRDCQVVLFERGLEDGFIKTRPRMPAMTNDQGFFRFAHLRAGTYFIVVNTRPWYAQHRASFDAPNISAPTVREDSSALDVTYPVIYYLSATDDESAQPITLHYGDNVIADMVLTPAVPALHVRVANHSRDLSQPKISTLMPHIFGAPSIAINAQTLSMNNGSQEIGGIPPGEYELITPNFNNPGGQNQAPGRKLVTLTRDGMLDVDDLTPPATVTGTVRFAGGITPEHAAIQIRDVDSGFSFANAISPKGDLEQLQLQPGKYEISVVTNNGFHVANIVAKGAKASGRMIEITKSGPVQLTILGSRETGHIDGVVQRMENGNGEPLAGAMVVLVPDDPSHNAPLFRRDQSDSDGTFSLNDIVPGKYTVIAIQNGWEMEWANPYVLASYIKNGEQVKIDAHSSLDLKINVQ